MDENDARRLWAPLEDVGELSMEKKKWWVCGCEFLATLARCTF
jgi:hypothetical protein